MAAEIAKFTLRTDKELLRKFRYVADYNGRSANRELEMLMKKQITDFERTQGRIVFDE